MSEKKSLGRQIEELYKKVKDRLPSDTLITDPAAFAEAVKNSEVEDDPNIEDWMKDEIRRLKRALDKFNKKLS